MPVKRDKQKEVFIELVNLQLKPHGKSCTDVKGDPEWYMKFKTTRESEKQFITEGAKIIKSKLGLSKKLAEKEMSWFILQWGLTTVDSYNQIEVQTEQLTDEEN